MGLYSKIYKQYKKDSKISANRALSFLYSFLIQKLSLSQAALKWGLNYASAKVIARKARICPPQFNMISLPPKSPFQKLCKIDVLNKEHIKFNENNQFTEESFHKQNKIEIISTIGQIWKPLLFYAH